MPQVVGQHLALERTGDVYRALCPFHKDKDTKSLVIYSDHCHCFGCRITLYPLTFLQRYLHISRQEARRRLGLIETTATLHTFTPIATVKTVPEPIDPEIIITWYRMLTSDGRAYFHSRLFTDKTIDTELWGWDGRRYILPVWDGEPGNSDCISVRRRAGSPDLEPKYIGLKGHNQPCLYNTWSARDAEVVYIFFGEFDARLAWQDGFPSVSPTNGQNTWDASWDRFFERFREIIIVPDKREELRAFQVASRFPWRSRVLSWPAGDFNDYNDFRRDAGGTPADFQALLGSVIAPDYEVECFWEV